MAAGRFARYWQDFEVGEVIETAPRTIEGGDVSLFAGLSGDFNPLHVNAVDAESGAFGERIAHGLLTLAVTSGQINQTALLVGTAIGILGLDKVRFSNPVRFGDTIFTSVKVTEARASSKASRGVVAMEVKVENQRDEVVLTYDMTLLMAGKPT
ncbi:MaoC/PaaZ C-terminal domain-containing protein [Paraburkholderia elongata]|uniref:Dehydratase n=1 Tax=Paraburkholderia elongata TaxID=2675747 RepID=A0A972SKS7_9BURK|nr:MaoC/PaaZ C-terminal domain-containing protein [Paraburkholderia elongata]NPT58469.1 dehydratase [Paraburkholderia elongata]